MSDYNCVDVIREAQATVVAAAQSSTSFIPPLGREKARVFTLNLRNRLIFKAADEEGALESADFIGKTKVIKKSWGYTGGKMSRNFSEQEEHKVKPHLLRNLPKHTCVVVHCERRSKGTISSIEHALSSLEERLKEREADLKHYHRQSEDLEKQLNQPFEHEEKFEAATKRQQKIVAALDITRTRLLLALTKEQSD